jgi:phage shock protein PspC (stress-responsive transcriptional regulator)
MKNVTPSNDTAWGKLREATRPKIHMIGGVCEALGAVTPLAPWMWRVVFCTTTVLWGVGPVAYLILWICIPPEKRTLSGSLSGN